MQIHKVIRSKFLKSWSDQVFLCPFVVRIECCWIAKFDYQWDADQGIHHLRSCSVCPPIPGKDRQPAGVLCKDLDDMLKYHTASEAVSLTDLLLMSGSTSPPPGFHMLVQYVATFCHLHSVPLAQPQLRRHDQQILDISQARILAHGHKSLVVQLGEENAVYKVQCSQGRSLLRVCSRTYMHKKALHLLLQVLVCRCTINGSPMVLSQQCMLCRLHNSGWLRMNS